VVEGEQGNSAYECLGEDGCGEVDGIEGADRLFGEGPASSFYDVGSDSENGPVFCRLSKSRATAGDPAFGQFAGGYRADKHPLALDKGEVRSEDEFGVCESLTDTARMSFTQKPRQNGTRFRIEIQASPRSRSRSLITSTSDNRGFSAG
jgi:hypothetical protein